MPVSSDIVRSAGGKSKFPYDAETWADANRFSARKWEVFMQFRTKIGYILLAATALSIPVSSYAQDGAESAEGEDGDIIIVTARSREENVQDVPIAITALTAEVLDKRGIENLNDAARFTPGFTFEQFDGGNAAPTIRGASQINVSNREQTTATFFDGVYMPRSWLVNGGTDGIQRLEIVKGPQGARFGRNAFSGAINFIPKKANFGGTSGEVSATFGNYSRFDVGGNVNLVLEPDILAVHGSYYHSDLDGTWRNAHPFANTGFSPGTNGRVGGYDNQSLSFGFLLSTGDRVSIDAAWYSFKRKDEAGAQQYRNTDSGGGNCGTLTGGQRRLFCGEFPVLGNTVTVDPRAFSRQSDVDIFRADAKFELSDAFNFYYTFGLVKADTLTGISAESDQVNCGTVLSPFIIAGNVRLCNFQATPLGEVDYKSNEFRVTYDNDGPVRAELGGFLLKGTDRNFFVSVNQPILSATNTAPLNITRVNSGPLTQFFPILPREFANFLLRNEVTKTDVKALFGEISFAFNGGATRVTAEGRYTEETIATRSLLPAPVPFDRKEKFTFFTPRVSLEHDLSDDNLLYLSAARGAKAGGFNSGARVVAPATTSPFQVYDPEFNWTYEIGSKNQLMDGKATFNIAAYYSDWTNQQVNGSDPNGNFLTTTITTNLGNARILGLEMEATFRPTAFISVDASASYVDAKFKGGAVDRVFATFGAPFTAPPCDNIVCNANGDISGNRLPRVPKFQAALGIQFGGEIGEVASFYIRGDGSYQSRSFADTINASIISDRFLVNARAGIDYKGFGFSIWARNLFDKKYVAASTQIIQRQGGNLLSSLYGDRRTLGLTASYKF
jgi:iron complex outermembrane receptor protein